MTHLSLRTITFLLLPPLLWAGNAVVGRVAVGYVSPLLLNALRWWLALALLLPLGWRVLKFDGPLWSRWQYFTVIGVLGIGSFNALQYAALQTSTPINVTLIGSSMPVWMLAVGALCYGERIRSGQIVGAMLSLSGVLLVLSRGSWDTLMQLQLVPGDLLVLIAIILWAFYSWMLARPQDPATRSWPWAEFLLAQLIFGTLWASLASAGEWARGHAHLQWNAVSIGSLLYVAIGPALIAYRSWGIGVAMAGPAVAAFFNNLTPVFAALLSTAMLGESPQWFHGCAFLLIIAGIFVSSRRQRAARE